MCLAAGVNWSLLKSTEVYRRFGEGDGSSDEFDLMVEMLMVSSVEMLYHQDVRSFW